MAPPTPLHQSATFYDGKWNEAVDIEFIDILVQETMNGHYRIGTHNYGAMLAAMNGVNARFKTDFDLKYCFGRFRKLKNRYDLFRWIIHLSGVTHDPITNHVECSKDGWEFICEKEPLARAYMLHGEKRWEGLRILFQEGPDSPEFVQAVDSVEIIDLSSDHDDDGVADAQIGKGEEIASIIRKDGYVIGKEVEPDNDWWADVAHEPLDNSLCILSPPSEFSSTEPKKKREPTAVASKITRRLWADEDSSCASFSPKKK